MTPDARKQRAREILGCICSPTDHECEHCLSLIADALPEWPSDEEQTVVSEPFTLELPKLLKTVNVKVLPEWPSDEEMNAANPFEAHTWGHEIWDKGARWLKARMEGKS